MTKRLAVAVGSVLLTSMHVRPGIAETAIVPAVQEVENSAAADVVRIALRPQRYEMGQRVAAATTVPAATASGTAARSQGNPRVTFEALGVLW